MKGQSAAAVACATLAVILNAGAIGMANQATSNWTSAIMRASENPQRMAMVLVSAPIEPVAPSVAPNTNAPVIPSLTAPARPPTQPPTARTTTPATPLESSQPVLFYTFRQVERPAFPVSDWNLDIDTLDEIGVQRLVFEVLVSDRGKVVGCTVLEPSDLADEAKRSLEKRMSETALLPAQRAGQLVASVRRIELLVAAAGPDALPDVPIHRP